MSNVLKKGELSVKIEKDRSKYWIGLFVVEVRGVEPLTSCMPCKRSSQLSYTPKYVDLAKCCNCALQNCTAKVIIFFILQSNFLCQHKLFMDL